MAEAAPEGIDDLQPLGPGIWRGRRGGRDVIARRVAFESEAVALRRIEHPALPRLLDLSGGFAVFERVDGESLERRLDRLGPLGWRDAVDVLRAAAGALDVLGRAGLRHGALRPTNVLFDAQGRVVFVDPVWSRAAPDSYLSPEEERGGRPDLRSDYYALGLLLHEMLLGLPAFVGRDPSRGALPFDVPGLPPELAEAGRALTRPDPAQRLANADDLLRLLGGLGAPPPPPAPRRPRRVAPVVFALFALALLFGLGAWKARKPPPKPKIVVTIPPIRVQPIQIPPPPPLLPPPPPSRPPAPPPGPALEEELASVTKFLSTADALATARDYARLEEAPAPRHAQAREALEAGLDPHRRAARAWAAAVKRLDAMKGRVLSVSLKDGGRLFGKVEEVDGLKLRVGGKDASLKDLDALSIARLAMSGSGAATDLEVLAFAIFEQDAATARLAAEDVEPDPWAAPRLAALLKAADEKAARDKRERDAELALRAADRAWKDYRPEMYGDVADLHAGTAAGAMAREKLAALRTSVARWAFNDGKAAGWTGELRPGGRWGGGGFHLRTEGKEGVASISLEGDALFVASAGARLRFDVRATLRTRVKVILEADGATSSLPVELRSSGWQAFDQPLSAFDGLREGTSIKALRIEARSDGAPVTLSLDSVELYIPK